MQYKNNKTYLLAEAVGCVIKELRIQQKYSINKFANEYSLDIGNTSRIEKGAIDVKLVTLWKIAEALSIKPSELIKLIEEKLGDNVFLFIEE